MPYIKTKE